MTNQDTLREIQRGYRLEKPHYSGEVSPDKLNGIYGVRYFNLNYIFKDYWGANVIHALFIFLYV